MANEQNLKPFKKGRSKEEAAAAGKLGGIKSGEARRLKRTMREAAEYFLSLPVKNDKILETLKKDGLIEPEDQTYQMAIISRAAYGALTGDIKSVELFCKLTGDLKENQNTQNINVNASEESVQIYIPDDGRNNQGE